MLFSIIIPHYQGVINDKDLNRCLDSIRKQSFKDYEVILLHDGELLHDWNIRKWSKLRIEVLPKRYNDWGHTPRDLGMIMARGDYIIHTNSDNEMYKEVLLVLSKTIKKTGYGVRYILPVMMMGMREGGFYDIPRDYSKRLTLKGNPAQGKIDLMQLVMRKDEWMKFGGWKDKTIDSDGKLYEEFCKEGHIFVKYCIGKHY